MNSDYKRVNWFVIMTGLVILFGHYLDCVQYGNACHSWGKLGIWSPRTRRNLFFGGLFIYVVFHTLTKEELMPNAIHLLRKVDISITKSLREREKNDDIIDFNGSGFSGDSHLAVDQDF